ncbi:MAG: M48 family metallopeptidase [Brachybacterium sp.]|nr:M48 family metallopeptidase [Brachybacterium sp.]
MNDRGPHRGITGPRGEPIVVVRSRRRRKTVSVSRREGTVEISIPAAMSRREEERWVREMVDRLARKDRRTAPGDAELEELARSLSEAHLQGRARPTSVTWSSRQQRSRWGSCTSVDGTIRISTRLQGMPDWVLHYVLLHELAHLLVPGHGADFWALLESYPRTERARGFLDGVSFAEN